MMIHSIILARGGSKGIKNKNLIIIKKKPLLYWSIIKSSNSKKIKYTWVSSDKKKILDFAKKNGAKTILRPKKYSTDSSTSESAWKHAINFIVKKKYKIDLIVGIQPTSPIRDSIDFDNAIKYFLKKKLDSLFSATKIHDFFTWSIYKGNIKANYDYKKRLRRQKIKKNYLENGSFYIFKKNYFLKYNNRLFGKIGAFIMEKKKSFQIDDLIDVKIINSLI